MAATQTGSIPSGIKSSTKALDIASTLAVQITELLDSTYGLRDLGNRADPIEELVYISLTRQTHRHNALRSWQSVAEAGGPEALLRMPLPRLVSLLAPGGFSKQKARWIRGSLRRIIRAVGSLSLSPVKRWSNARVEAFLRTLPGVGIKSAKCIMLYSLRRQVLPVDVHLRRIATRVGLVSEGLSEKRIHEELERVVPPEHRHSLHVNAIWHGRAVCTALHPRCYQCVLQQQCRFGRRAARGRAPAF